MKRPNPLLGTVIAAIGLCALTAGAMEESHPGAPKFLVVPGDFRGELPFSDAVRVGNLLFLSGKLGNQPGTRNLAAGGIKSETRQALTNIKATVERWGSSMDRVVKCTVFLADMGEWAAMNEVYVTFFPERKPARSAVGVNGLALDARVEIECIAAVGG